MDLKSKLTQEEKDYMQEQFEKVVHKVLVAGATVGVYHTVSEMTCVNRGKIALLSEKQQEGIDRVVDEIEDELARGTEIGLLERMQGEGPQS